MIILNFLNFIISQQKYLVDFLVNCLNFACQLDLFVFIRFQPNIYHKNQYYLVKFNYLTIFIKQFTNFNIEQIIKDINNGFRIISLYFKFINFQYLVINNYLENNLFYWIFDLFTFILQLLNSENLNFIDFLNLILKNYQGNYYILTLFQVSKLFILQLLSNFNFKNI